MTWIAMSGDMTYLYTGPAIPSRNPNCSSGMKPLSLSIMSVGVIPRAFSWWEEGERREREREEREEEEGERREEGKVCGLLDRCVDDMQRQLGSCTPPLD